MREELGAADAVRDEVILALGERGEEGGGERVGSRIVDYGVCAEGGCKFRVAGGADGCYVDVVELFRDCKVGLDVSDDTLL